MYCNILLKVYTGGFMSDNAKLVIHENLKIGQISQDDALVILQKT